MAGNVLARQRTARQYNGSDERYTPPWLLQRVTAFMGEGWLDPCPASYGRVPQVNGLEIRWNGCVFCNPPYSQMKAWATKFCTESFDEGLLLTLAYTDTAWFRPLFAYTILFPQGRIHFLDMAGQIVRPPFGSALIYRGKRNKDFARSFGDMGSIVRPAYRRMSPTLWDRGVAP